MLVVWKWILRVPKEEFGRCIAKRQALSTGC